MSKTQIFLLVSIVVLLLGGGVGLYLVTKPKDITDSAASSGIGQFQNTNPTPMETTLDYSDSSGFSFKYPAGFSVKDITPDDDTTYSFLNITKGSEKIIVKIEDTKYKSLVDWEKDYSSATMVGATTLAGKTAKQYKLSGKMATVAIDSGIIYYIEYTGVNENAYTTLVDSFTLASSQTANAGSGGATDNAIYEDEEIVE